MRGEVREYGRIANTPTALDRLMRKLSGEGVGLQFCYEAGPCGYGIQRHLSAHGHECMLVEGGGVQANETRKSAERQIAAMNRKDRLQARGIVVGVYPELLGFQIAQNNASKTVEQWPSIKTPTMNTKPYPSASGGTKCCGREGRLAVEQRTNITAFGTRDGRLSPLLDRVPTTLRR